MLVAGGQPRTGSTVCYQVACKVVEQLGIGKGMCFKFRAGSFTVAELEDMRASDRVYVVKRHTWCEQFGQDIKVLMTVRDLRDVAVSYQHFFKDRKNIFDSFPNVPLAQHSVWLENVPAENIAVIKYEDYILGDNLLRLPYLIAHFLDVGIEDSVAQAIANECQLQRNIARLLHYENESRDNYGYVAGRHFYGGESGVWQKELSVFEVAQIVTQGKDYMVKYGYMEDCNNEGR